MGLMTGGRQTVPVQFGIGQSWPTVAEASPARGVVSPLRPVMPMSHPGLLNQQWQGDVAMQQVEASGPPGGPSPSPTDIPILRRCVNYRYCKNLVPDDAHYFGFCGECVEIATRVRDYGYDGLPTYVWSEAFRMPPGFLSTVSSSGPASEENQRAWETHLARGTLPPSAATQPEALQASAGELGLKSVAVDLGMSLQGEALSNAKASGAPAA